MSHDPITLSVIIQDGDSEAALISALQQVMEHYTPSHSADPYVQDEYQEMRSRAACWLSDRHRYGRPLPSGVGIAA